MKTENPMKMNREFVKSTWVVHYELFIVLNSRFPPEDRIKFGEFQNFTSLVLMKKKMNWKWIQVMWNWHCLIVLNWRFIRKILATKKSRKYKWNMNVLKFLNFLILLNVWNMNLFQFNIYYNVTKNIFTFALSSSCVFYYEFRDNTVLLC